VFSRRSAQFRRTFPIPHSEFRIPQSVLIMVRVISGEFRSRRLKTLEGTETRPTSDRLKETLFNLLQERIKGCCFLDCFAGSGAVGIEALSRGALLVAFVEPQPDALKVLRQNLVALGLERSSRCQLVCQPAATALKILGRSGKKFDIVFLDPPYAAAKQYLLALQRLEADRLLNTGAFVVAEHSKFLALPDQITELAKFREVRQGDSVLSLFRIQVQPDGKRA
jgi:16S rRNA (guanine966-N2)-methyltransferase